MNEQLTIVVISITTSRTNDDTKSWTTGTAYDLSTTPVGAYVFDGWAYHGFITVNVLN